MSVNELMEVRKVCQLSVLCSTEHPFSKRIFPFHQKDVIRSGVSAAKDTSRLVLGLSRLVTVQISPWPALVAQGTRGVYSGLFGIVDDVRREELGCLFNMSSSSSFIYHD